MLPLMRKAFTMLELIFVIVVMGIIGTIGAEIFRSTYDSYMSSSVNNRLQYETELALQQIANRLQYRFKDSVIAREAGGNFVGLSSTTVASTYTTVEWVGYDIDGWQGVWDGASFNRPTWSGFIDLDANDVAPADGLIDDPNLILTPGTNTNNISAIIQNVRAAGSATDINNAAIFFTGANTDIQNGYGWNGTVLTDQNGSAAHRITTDAGGNLAAFNSGNADNFSGVDVYEQYKLAWTAYGLELDGNGNLFFHYDYQPWEGDSIANGDSTAVLLMENVDTFQVQAIGDVIKVQLCVDNNASGAVPASQIYSLCKEKVIF